MRPATIELVNDKTMIWEHTGHPHRYYTVVEKSWDTEQDCLVVQYRPLYPCDYSSFTRTLEGFVAVNPQTGVPRFIAHTADELKAFWAHPMSAKLDPTLVPAEFLPQPPVTRDPMTMPRSCNGKDGTPGSYCTFPFHTPGHEKCQHVAFLGSYELPKGTSEVYQEQHLNAQTPLLVSE